MPDLPNTLALTSIADDSEIIASTHRNNNSAVQDAVNLLRAALAGGTAGQVLQATDSDTVGWANQGALYRKTTQKDVVSTVAETDLLNGEITIGAAVLGTTKAIRATLLGDYLNNTGGNQNITVKVKLGATTLWAATVTAIGASANRRVFSMRFTLGNQNSASVQFLSGDLLMTTTTAATTGVGAGDGAAAFGGPFAGSAAEDTTSSKALVVTVTHSASSASLSCRMQYATVEVV